VIMPNHAHVLLRAFENHSLSSIMKTVKSVTAHKINKLLGRSGPVWQPDYFDRYIRDQEHFARTVRYIENNPVKAGLCNAPEEWKFSSASFHDASQGDSTQAARPMKNADEGVRAPSAGLNITTMCLDRWQTDEMKDQPALIWEGEEG